MEWAGFTLRHAGPHVLSGVVAVHGSLGVQVNHLVEAELATVDGGSLRFQSDDQLLGVVTGDQVSLSQRRVILINHYGVNRLDM